MYLSLMSILYHFRFLKIIMWFTRHLLQAEDSDRYNNTINFTTNANDFDTTEFPAGLFTAEELKSGAVLLYIIGTVKQRNFLIYLYR